MGSASELEYYLMLAYDLKLLAQPVSERLIDEAGHVKRMLTGLTRKVRA